LYSRIYGRHICFCDWKSNMTSIILIETPTQIDQAPNAYWLHVFRGGSPIIRIISRNISRSDLWHLQPYATRWRSAPDSHPVPISRLSSSYLLPAYYPCNVAFTRRLLQLASTPELVIRTRVRIARGFGASGIRDVRNSRTNTHTRVQVRRGPSSCTTVCSTGEKGWLALDY